MIYEISISFDPADTVLQAGLALSASLIKYNCDEMTGASPFPPPLPSCYRTVARKKIDSVWKSRNHFSIKNLSPNIRQKYKLSSTQLEVKCNLNHKISEMDDIRSQAQTGWRLERRLTAPDHKITRPKDSKIDGITGEVKSQLWKNTNGLSASSRGFSEYYLVPQRNRNGKAKGGNTDTPRTYSQQWVDESEGREDSEVRSSAVSNPCWLDRKEGSNSFSDP